MTRFAVSCVNDLSSCRQIFNFFFLISPNCSHQFNSGIVSRHFASQTTWNNGEMIAESNSQKTFFAIVLYTNMAAVTSRENQEFLMLVAAMLIYGHKRKHFNKNRALFPKDFFISPKWPRLRSFTPPAKLLCSCLRPTGK